MSDTPAELAPEPVESQALPTPAVSPKTSEAPPSAALDADTLVSRLETSLLPRLKDYIDRGNQSVKDRRIAGQERSLTEIREELQSFKARLDAHGGDVNKAAQEVAVERILSREEQSANLGKVGEDWEAGVQKILSEAEKSAGVKVPLDDPELQAAAGGKYASWADAYAAVNRIVLRRARGVPALATEVAGGSATTGNIDELTSQLNKLIEANAPTDVMKAAKEKLIAAMRK